MENSTLLGKTSAGSEACEVLGMPLDAKKEEGPAVVLTFLGIELDVQVGGQAAEGAAERAQEQAVGMERHEEVPQEGPLVHHWPVELCLQSVASWTIVPEETVGLEHDCVQDGLVVAAECVIQSRHRVVVEIRCPVERREHDEGRCGGRRATSGAHNRRLRLLGLRSSVRTKVVPAGLGEGCSIKEWSIMPKELLPIVVAAAVWGRRWRGLTVKARCDNMAVAATIKSGSCKEAHAMQLRRCLAFLEASNAFVLVAEHIREADNVVADALSRDRLSVALICMQEAAAEAEPVPLGLVEVLTATGAAWSEQQWKVLQIFTSTKA